MWFWNRNKDRIDECNTIVIRNADNMSREYITTDIFSDIFIYGAVTTRDRISIE